MNHFELVDKSEYPKLLQFYKDGVFFFPLIAAVLQQDQAGSVYCFSEGGRNTFLIVHNFGFSQIIGDLESHRIKAILSLIEKEPPVGLPGKVRVYHPASTGTEHFESGDNIQKAERCQFELLDCDVTNRPSYDLEYDLVKIDVGIIRKVSQTLPIDLESRFWNSGSEFLASGLGCVAIKSSEILGICYSAAVGQGVAEIDIYIETEHRQSGVGYSLGVKFIEMCAKSGLVPNWDCFTNNKPSYALATRLGFVPKSKYDFYTITLRSP